LTSSVELEHEVDELDSAISEAIKSFANEKGTLKEHAQRAIREMTEEADATRKLLEEARGMLEDFEVTEAHATDTLRLAEVARLKLRNISLEEMRAVMSILDIHVEITGEHKAKQSGKPFPVSESHKTTETLVPAEVSPDEWAHVKKTLIELHGYRHVRGDLRGAFNGILRRLRTGEGVADLGPEYGTQAVQADRALKWLRDGTWNSS